MRSSFYEMKKCRFSLLVALAGMFLLLFASHGLSQPADESAAENLLEEVSYVSEASSPTVKLVTKDAVGYRYTVYDSIDPLRVMIDFPGMDVSKVKEAVQVSSDLVKEIRVSSFELTSGQLGRVELILSEMSEYEVVLTGNEFLVVFAGLAASDVAAEPVKVEVAQESASAIQAAPVAETQGLSGPATTVQAVDIRQSDIILETNGAIEKYRYFRLTNPARLVVDVRGVRPGFGQRLFEVGEGFRRVRVGTYEDKTRFVFDAAGAKLPAYTVSKSGNAVIVSWDSQRTAPPPDSPRTVNRPTRPVAQSAQAVVEGVDFMLEGSRSLLTVSLDGPPRVIHPTQQGNIVRFGVENVRISRALRRSIDTSSFPSAVRMITPYTVLENGKQNVRFAVELKGPAPYTLEQKGNQVLFYVQNGAFAEARPAEVEHLLVDAPATQAPKPEPEALSLAPAAAQPSAPVVIASPLQHGKKYTGESMSLVFQDADIRSILQLIGDVSGYNVVYKDDVKGKISLRLIDVPWDQALDIVLENQDLGMVKDGNVVYIRPKAKILEDERKALSLVSDKRKLEPMVLEVFKVNYADVKDMAAKIKPHLSDGGSITPDARTRQLLITDRASKLEEVRGLLAKLDLPERQVMIEARIVEADSNFSHNLGVSWGFSYAKTDGSGLSNVSEADVGLGGNFFISPPSEAGTVSASAGIGSDIVFGTVGVDSTILDLRISALETAGSGKVISTPRVATLNGEKAKISQGTSIPYQVVSQDGTSTEFVDASLSLEVTPVINPDNSIVLDIKATNSSPGSTVATGAGEAPAIDTKEAETKVLVQNGETTVIGGIFVEDEDYSEAGVPWLMHAPIIGHLFKSKSNNQTRSELLVFITPRVVE